MRGIADAATGRSSVLAANILCFAYNDCSGSGGEIATRLKRQYPERIYDLRPVDIEVEDENKLAPFKVSLHPNPTKESFKLRIEGMREGQTARFQLSNMEGKRVLEKQINNPLQEINVAELKKGAYLYILMIDSKTISSGKLIIQ